MEKLIRDKLVDHMTSSNIFGNTQHGFISGRSCITKLLEHIEDLTEGIDNGEDVAVIYLDFCNALIKPLIKGLFLSWNSVVFKVTSYFG